jgi:hypothetical protein
VFRKMHLKARKKRSALAATGNEEALEKEMDN